MNVQLCRDKGVPHKASPHIVKQATPDVVLDAHGHATVDEEDSPKEVSQPRDGGRVLELHLADHQNDPGDVKQLG
eukprot:scaffold129050_cov35-Tisochrysis_lutea.AAC.3